MAETKKAPAKVSAKKKAPTRKKKEALSPLSRAEMLDAMVIDLKHRYPGKVFQGPEYTMPWMIRRLPTGITSLDIALSGGLPAGGFSMLYGAEGVGKNYLLNRVIAIQQQIWGEEVCVGLINTEMPYDKTFGRLCGVKIGFSESEIRALQEDWLETTGEPMPQETVDDYSAEIGKIIVVPPGVAESLFELTLSMVETRQFTVIGIDSFGGILTTHEDEQTLEDAMRPGGAAGLNTRFMTRLYPLLSTNSEGEPNLTALIGLNQARLNMKKKNKYSPDFTESGGKALQHARWVGIELSKGGWIRKNENIVGKVIRWKIVKQKAGGHEGAVGTYDFMYQPLGANIAQEILLAGVDFGVITKRGSWFSMGDHKLGQGTASAANNLVDMNLIDKVERMIMVKAGILRDFRKRCE